MNYRKSVLKAPVNFINDMRLWTQGETSQTDSKCGLDDTDNSRD